MAGKWNSPELYKIIFENSMINSIERLRSVELKI